MRHLKTFESESASDRLGIDINDVKECFYDLSDNGWVINTRFAKRLRNAKVEKGVNKWDGVVSMDLVPYLEIRIHMKFPLRVSVMTLQELQEKDTYKDCITQLKGILNDHDLFISQEKVERIKSGGSQIYILIYRKSDENYIK